MNVEPSAGVRAASLVWLAPLALGAGRPPPSPIVIYQDKPRTIQVLFLASVREEGCFDAHCYAVVDATAKLAAVVDPGRRTGPRMHQHLKREGIKPTYVLITHGHGDHTGGVEHFLENTSAKIVTNRVEAQQFPSLIRPSTTSQPAGSTQAGRHVLATDECMIQCGSLQFRVLLTPGHTVGSQCYYLADQHLVFVGDTVLRGSIGRTDLPGSAGRTCLVAYAQAKILSLPGHTRILPGHGQFTTVAWEKATNPYFAGRDPLAGYQESTCREGARAECAD